MEKVTIKEIKLLAGIVCQQLNSECNEKRNARNKSRNNKTKRITMLAREAIDAIPEIKNDKDFDVRVEAEWVGDYSPYKEYYTNTIINVLSLSPPKKGNITEMIEESMKIVNDYIKVTNK
jgi:stage III sporulation protein SpoIIIAA